MTNTLRTHESLPLNKSMSYGPDCKGRQVLGILRKASHMALCKACHMALTKPTKRNTHKMILTYSWRGHLGPPHRHCGFSTWGGHRRYVGFWFNSTLSQYLYFCTSKTSKWSTVLRVRDLSQRHVTRSCTALSRVSVFVLLY